MLRTFVYAVLALACGTFAGCAQNPGASATQANSVETGTLSIRGQAATAPRAQHDRHDRPEGPGEAEQVDPGRFR